MRPIGTGLGPDASQERGNAAHWVLELVHCDVFLQRSATVVVKIKEFVWKSEALCHESGK